MRKVEKGEVEQCLELARQEGTYTQVRMLHIHRNKTGHNTVSATV